MFAYTDLLYFSSIIFKKKITISLRKATFQKKIFQIRKNQLVLYYDFDGIGNLEDLPRHVFIDEECWNVRIINDRGELPRNISQKPKSDVLQQLKNICDKCCKREYSFSNHVKY